MSEYKQDQILDQDYDGIQEFDNRLPDWWLWILYGSIVFAAGYWLVFETLDMVPNPGGRYEQEMMAAREAQLERMAAGGPTEESLLLMASLPDRVSEGRELFEKHCVSCHNPRGEGNVGPNLTDRYWLHGGAAMDIYNTITNGVLEKGMVAWGPQLGPTRVQKATAYILSIKNTEVPGKDPQGELYEGP